MRRRGSATQRGIGPICADAGSGRRGQRADDHPECPDRGECVVGATRGADANRATCAVHCASFDPTRAVRERRPRGAGARISGFAATRRIDRDEQTQYPDCAVRRRFATERADSGCAASTRHGVLAVAGAAAPTRDALTGAAAKRGSVHCRVAAR
jgi:hypothetical protein